ncbi:unnamed protein product, partial [marine sediment metagenome]
LETLLEIKQNPSFRIKNIEIFFSLQFTDEITARTKGKFTRKLSTVEMSAVL